MHTQDGQRRDTLQQQGALYALAAYTFWGVAPVYFVWVAFAEPLEVLAHRVLWALPLLAAMVSLSRTWTHLRTLPAPAFRRLALCAVLLSINWLTFIYAIQQERIAETALGYFVNPLVSILLGWMFLGEQMRPVQWLAAGLAGLGIITELMVTGQVPLLGLLLAFSFGFYGLVRKQTEVPAALGLGIETTLVAPLALIYLLVFHTGAAAPERTNSELALLALGGAVTVLPLVWFGAAAARLPLTILGFFQYLAPSISLIIAVAVYAEVVTTARWINLGFIWLGLLVFSLESVYVNRSQKLEGF